MSRNGYVPKRLCPETVMSRSGYVPKRSCPEVAMSRNGYVPKRSCPEVPDIPLIVTLSLRPNPKVAKLSLVKLVVLVL